MSDVEWRPRDDSGVRIGSSRMDIAVARAARREGPDGVLQENVGAPSAPGAAAREVLVAGQSDEIAIPFVVDLDPRGLTFLAELSSSDELPPRHWADARLSDA